MSRLALEYGITGNGLAKICDRLKVPYPPRGYWAKKAAGKKVVTYRLPEPDEPTPGSTTITPTPPAPKAPEVPPEVRKQLDKVQTQAIEVKERLLRPHRVIARWIEERDRRRREARQNRDGWGPSDPGKFTDTEVRQHRILDALFKELERRGGKVEEPKRGEVGVELQGERIEFQLREKLKQVRRVPTKEEEREWRKFIQEMHPTGKLVFSIKTYMPWGIRTEWLETDGKPMESLLPEIVSTLLAAAPLLVQQRKEREEAERQRQREERKRYEEQQRKQLIRNRLRKFLEFADEWKAAQSAKEFLAALRSKHYDDETKIGDYSLSSWIDWMEDAIEEANPLTKGPAFVFDQVARIQT